MSTSTSSRQQTDRSVSTELAQPIRTTEMVTVKSTPTVKMTSPSSTTTSDAFGRFTLFICQKSRVVRIYLHTWSHEI
ncbi:hypothetical protein Smp_109870 [Schistosoma mansoni]|uniref:hypothetical protein n=1 Tax=Schistosoma mansoni TaxID=6183 RepID=UPI00022C8210|nr:hypothetical protein Smp_109870 [Schistosoma mansoni]|eukprot:XP_018646736.1 hypothetical protein Smp_109870 [Schistosoma mansoni]